ncbi:hypothetical protein [Comamonas terrigena]|uniref:hypothetical protein n=1 Tax=Comamonas terrigena TaxID=32013 RepID=UPI00244D0BDC|nr:hypothetical protein [Comamonas terrigena]MDH1704239.1 hypothetical protein [Comamonas terrigena]
MSAMLPPLSKAARSAALERLWPVCTRMVRVRDNPEIPCYDPSPAKLQAIGKQREEAKKFFRSSSNFGIQCKASLLRAAGSGGQEDQKIL